MIQHPSCYQRAGADLKIQRQVIPQKLFSASFNIHTPTIHHVIETQVQISKFKRQVRPYRVTCTRSFLLGMSHQINIHTHTILIHNIIDTVHLHLYNNCCVFIALHWESCESIAKCKPSLVSTVVKSNIVWTLITFQKDAHLTLLHVCAKILCWNFKILLVC